MQIYLPIADLPVNIFVVLAIGLAVGFISGMFGIGGGFLMTPLLIFLGVQPAVAVASVTGHIAASSMSGAISYWRRNAVDLALVFMLLAGGLIGTVSGVWLFTLLRVLLPAPARPRRPAWGHRTGIAAIRAWKRSQSSQADGQEMAY